MRRFKSRLKDVDIPKKNPFSNDKFDRKKYAESLRALAISCSDSGCVFAINGSWGAGKTTFVKMWSQYMSDCNHQVVYFNAWESDYANDPLVPMLAELRSLVSKESAFINVAAPLLSLVGEAALLKFTGLSAEEVKRAFQGDELLQEYLRQKEVVENFKTALSTCVAGDNGSELPLIFIVDELDRCNPAYAVRVLERIKHILDVPNIFFVLAINKEQLEHSIRGFYGTDGIDSANYLRRFIDIEFDLPSISASSACDYLYDYYEFDKYFDNNPQHDALSFKDAFKNMLARIVKGRGLDLRTLSRICSYTRLVFMTLGAGYKKIADVILLLCYLKCDQRELYVRIKAKQLSLSELYNELEILFLGKVPSSDVDIRLDSLNLLETLSRLIHVYNMGSYSLASERWLAELSKDGDLLIHSSHFMDDELKRSLVLQRGILSSGFTLSGTIDRLELSDAFKLTV